MERRKKIVSKWLLFYPEHKAKYTRELDRLMYPSIKLSDMPKAKDGAEHDRTGDQIADMVDSPEAQWIQLAEDVTRDISPRMQIYLKLRQEYRYGRNWFIPVQSKYCYAVAEAEGKEPEACWVEGRQYFFIWWDQICNYTIVKATERNLF